MIGRAAIALAIAATCGAGAAHAHVVYGTATLRGLVRESDLVVRARIVGAGDERGSAAPVVVAEPLEVIKGGPTAGPLHFVQHGHGVPLYEKGDEVALFLQSIDRSRELGALAALVDWVAIQEGEALTLDDGRRPGIVAALRAYAALETLPPAAQLEALRRVTLELLSSPHAVLASSAVRDLALTGDAPIVRAEDVAALEPVLASTAVPIGVRLALLAELERRGLVEAPPRWAKLVRETQGLDRFSAVRAAAAHPSAPVTGELVRLLAGDDAQLVAEAAIALGSPGNERAVAPLTALMASNEERVRMAAIRGLGRIGTPSARARLADAAASHPDRATRRRARAEVELSGGSARGRAQAQP